jgi:SSS family solute:Na+ symporter
MALYWRRATGPGALAAMLAGAGTVIALNVGPASWRLGYDPFLWAMATSLLAGVGVSLATKPPDAAWVSRLFDDQRSTSATSAQ